MLVSTQNFPGAARLYRFDMNGKFLNEIGRPGRGPGEHTGYDLTFCDYYDENKMVVAIWFDDPQLFHPDGTFLRSIHKPYEFLENTYKWNDQEWYSVGMAGGRPRSALDSAILMFYSPDGHIYKTIPRTRYPSENNNGYVPAPWNQSVYLNKGRRKIFLQGNDTIFALEDKDLIPAGIIKSGQNSLDYNSTLLPEREKGKYRISILAENENNWFLRKSVVKSADLKQYAPGKWGGQYDMDEQLVIVDKKNGKAAVCKLTDDLYSFFPENFMQYLDWHDNKYLTFSLPTVKLLELIKKYESKATVPTQIAKRLQSIKQIKEDDNPVVFLSP